MQRASKWLTRSNGLPCWRRSHGICPDVAFVWRKFLEFIVFRHRLNSRSGAGRRRIIRRGSNIVGLVQWILSRTDITSCDQLVGRIQQAPNTLVHRRCCRLDKPHVPILLSCPCGEIQRITSCQKWKCITSIRRETDPTRLPKKSSHSRSGDDSSA